MDNKQLSTDNKNHLTKCVSDLYKACEEANHCEIKKLVNEYIYSYSKLDDALRKLLLKIDIENESYRESIQVILKVSNVNYQNPDDKSTIIMEVCGKGEVLLVKFFLQCTFDGKLIEDIINYSLMDNANCNFIHYIFYRNTNEHDAVDILRYFLDTYRNKPEHIKLFSVQLEAKDKAGNAPISKLLTKGWHQMLKLYLSYVPFKSMIVDENNNLLHCAIAGQSVGCLKLILFNCKIEELKQKNKDGLTPVQYANKKSYLFFVRIMEQYEKNHLNIKYRKHFLNDNITNASLNLIDLFQKEEYEEIECILSQYKLIQSINNDMPSYSILWNILLIEYKAKAKNKIIDIKKTDNKPNINTNPKNKHSNKNNSNCNRLNNDHYNSLFNFFDNTISDNVVKSHNEDISGPIDIIIYNKGFAYFINGELMSAIKTYSLYLNYILKQNDTAYYKWIIYVNTSFILIEILYSYNHITICHIIIEKIEEFLISSYRLRNETFYNSDIIDKIYNYLNDSELFHRFTPGWDESFCYLLLLKIMTNYSNRSNQIITEYKKRVKSCSYVNELKVFQRMNCMYSFLKIKMNYFQNTTKCLKKLNLFTTKSFNKEYLFFYYNSIGILNLKLKQYSNAEFLLKSSIVCFRQSINESNMFPDYKKRIEYLCKLMFNLALALFYQRKFKKAREILSQLINIRIVQKNVFVWYRLGLCALEIELGNRTEYSSYSGICKDVQLYSTHKSQKDKNDQEQDHFSVELNEEENHNNSNSSGDLNELYIQFEKECAALSKEDLNDDSNSVNNKQHEYNRFILHGKECKKKSHSVYLLEAIKAFKQVILLSKTNTITPNEVNDIIQFYSKHINNSGNNSNRNSNSNSNSNDSNTQNRANPYTQKGTCQTILISSYYNLLFTLSLKEEWIEILFFVKDFFSNKNLKSCQLSDIKIKVVHYQIEALIYLNKEKEALDIIQTYLSTSQNVSYRFDYYCKGIQTLQPDISFKLNFYISLAIIYIRTKDLSQADQCIQNIFKTFIKDRKNLSPYIISLLIYYYISQGRSKIPNLLMLLKNRKLIHLNQLGMINSNITC